MADGSYMKMRSGLGVGTDLGKQLANRNLKPGGDRGNRIVEGTFDRFFPREQACWIFISPTSFKYEVYDREQKEVITTETTWLETIQHFVPKLKRGFSCSAGPHLDKPCWGDAINRHHYENLDRIKEQTGIRPEERSPVGRSSQFSLAITVMEKIYELPVMEKDGTTPRRNKGGAMIYKYVPEPFVDASLRKLYKPTFGRRMHWSMSGEALRQLVLTIGPRLSHYCTRCASAMYATHLVCPNCETSFEVNRLKGEDLLVAASEERDCDACKETGVFVPRYGCTGCEKAKPGGSLMSFDLRVKRTKTSDNSSLLEVVEIRTPTHLNEDNPDEIRESLIKMVNEPLNLPAIFAPTPLGVQKSMIGKELTDGLSPEPRKTAATATESYESDTLPFGDDD